MSDRLDVTATKVAEETEDLVLASEEIADLAQALSTDADITASKARHVAMRARRLGTERKVASKVPPGD